jgi:hypothetical protein
MRINVNLSVQFCSAVELRMNQKLRKAGTARRRKDTLRRWDLFGKPVPRAYTIGNRMSVGERWTDVTRVRVHTSPVGHALTDAS